MNCLAYSLRFWKDNPEYRLFYNHEHVVAVDGHEMDVKGARIPFLPLEDYGYSFFTGAFCGLLDDYEEGLLREYFGLD